MQIAVYAILFGIFFLIVRALYFAFTKKEITISKRIYGVNGVSLILSLFVNKFIIGYRTPVLVWGNAKSIIINFIAFSVIYLLFKYLIMRNKAWRENLLLVEKDWIARQICAMPKRILIVVGIGIFIYVAFYVAIYLIAAFVAILILVMCFPWLAMFFS